MTQVLPGPIPPGTHTHPSPSPWGHAVTHDGRETLTVLLDRPPNVTEHYWMPAGVHFYVPGHICGENGRGWSTYDSRCETCDTEPKAVIRVTAFDWLRWTRVELTDEAVFLDYLTGREWRVRRTFPQDNPDRPEVPGFYEPRYVGYPVDAGGRVAP